MSRYPHFSLNRLMAIARHLREGRHASCRSLATEHEVCERTIRRDLDRLRDIFGAPLEWEPSTKTWFLNGAWDGVGSFSLNSTENLALVLAEKSFRRWRNTPLGTALHAVIGKIAEAAGEHIRHSWQSLADAVYTPPEDDAAWREEKHFGPITEAIRNHRTLRLDYTKPGRDAPSQRRVYPLGLGEIDRRWTLVARDPRAPGDGIRKFLLARMTRCQELSETFERPLHFDLTRYVNGGIGLFTGNTLHTVEAAFSPYAAAYLRETPWHPSQTLRDLPDGRVHATWQVTHLLDIQRRLLSWGEHVTVLGPPALLSTFRQIAQDFSRKYPAHADPGHDLSEVS